MYGYCSLQDMCDNNYFLLDSSAPGASGNFYASFQPGQVHNAKTGQFCFLLQMAGSYLPQTFDITWRTQQDLNWKHVVLAQVETGQGAKNIDTGLYCGVVTWTATLLEIVGSVCQPMLFRSATLRRL